ncbi:glycosyltransferase family 9 protein [Parashewanella spongiae]|uniref:Glycosyltransferase family 9 protein n=1 Tax=Parashewanella spongiae TaxID=342950 RepID=A0A3A6UA64_9GAMM|nr:glycosyltransferase family 9 protein [Parashewanella spongiae]MCL1077130.1 glycosyltransferase family 9 protein [Parashewanella spongiae]RJY18847.1 glycosyltransferase family 9 protein [Parashewanella spongiae]
MSLDLSSKQSLCVLRLSAIGDVCHAVAMVQAIQRQYPHLLITWVVGKLEYQLIKHIPDVEFVIFDKSQGWRSYANLRKALSGQTFDVLLHMQVALRASVASLMIRAKVKIGFDEARAKEGQWLFTNSKIAPQHQPHVLDGFMGFAKAIGVVDITPKWSIPVMEDDVEWVKARFPVGKVLVICAAASKAERNWLPERYAAVADYAVLKGYHVVLCGGPTALEKALAEKIESSAQQSLLNLVGETTLLQLLEILKQADCVLAPDTGPAHMATTQGTKVIGLYAHSNPYRTGPYHSLNSVVSVYEQVIAEQHDTSVPWGTRAKGEGLMQGIAVENVTALIP